MNEISIGEVLRLRREELSVSKKEIYNGICSHTAYARYENNERLPSKLVCDLLLQRLGFDSAKIEYAISIKLAEGESSIDEKIRQQQNIIKDNSYHDSENQRKQLEEAWMLTREDELNSSLQSDKKLLGDVECKILEEYVLLEENDLNKLKALYNLKEILANNAQSKEKQQIFIDVLIEIYMAELKMNNAGNANNAINLAMETAINNYDLKALSKIFGLRNNGTSDDDLEVLFAVLKSTGFDGIISEEGQRLWENTISQKLSDIVDCTTI